MAIWRSALEPHPPKLEQECFGYYPDDINEVLLPIPLPCGQQFLPPEHSFITCECKATPLCKTKRCFCKKQNTLCTALCGCNSEECNNQGDDDEDEDIDYNVDTDDDSDATSGSEEDNYLIMFLVFIRRRSCT